MRIKFWLRRLAGLLGDSTKWANIQWYRRFRGGVWYHVSLELHNYTGTFWSRYGTKFEHIERAISMEVYAYDYRGQAVEVGDLVRVRDFALRRPSDKDRVFMTQSVFAGDGTVWVKLSDGNSYAPYQLQLCGKG